MADSIETTIDSIIVAAQVLADLSNGIIDSASAEVDPAALGSHAVPAPSLALYSALDRVPAPMQEDVRASINEMISRVSGLFGGGDFDMLAVDLEDRAAVAHSLQRLIEDKEKFNGSDYQSELDREQETFDQSLLLSERRIKDQWAARGYPRAPGQMTRELAEDYTVKYFALNERRLQIMTKAYVGVLPQFKAAIKQAQELALRLRTDSYRATAQMIRSSAQHSALPGVQYAAQVQTESAMADALIAQYKAKKVYDEQLLRTYLSNTETEMVLNRYYASMYPRGVDNAVKLSIAKAHAVGVDAASLWQALNVVVGESTVTF